MFIKIFFMLAFGHDCRGKESLVHLNLICPGVVSAISKTVIFPGSESPK